MAQGMSLDAATGPLRREFREVQAEFYSRRAASFRGQ
jgi:hypothetical protein